MSKCVRWILSKWYARLRAIDLDVLWPTCCSSTKDLEEAREAFRVHALMDEAWLFLGEAEIERQIKELI